MTQLAEAASEAEALEALHRANLTDGLPVVIPTQERVAEMILASGYDGDVVLGTAGPAQAAATVHAVAVNAVMAGCLPEHFPVVVAAVRAITDPIFDMTEVQVTTHPVTPLILVNGPAREQCGLSHGTGAFGPGHRGNASIGRAVRLVMMNIGGGRPGIDMAVYGSPTKFAFCAAENEEDSPFPPLHVSRGMDAEQSAVTVIATEGPHSVCCVPVPDGMQDRESDIWISLIASAVGTTGSNTTYFERGTIVIILNPQLANTFAKAGHTRESLAEAFVARSRHKRSYLRSLNPGLVGPGGDDDMIPKRDPATILIAVTGGGGHYALVCPTLGVGPHNNSPVTKEIEINQHCEIPVRN